LWPMTVRAHACICGIRPCIYVASDSKRACGVPLCVGACACADDGLERDPSDIVIAEWMSGAWSCGAVRRWSGGGRRCALERKQPEAVPMPYYHGTACGTARHREPNEGVRVEPSPGLDATNLSSCGAACFSLLSRGSGKAVAV